MSAEISPAESAAVPPAASSPSGTEPAVEDPSTTDAGTLVRRYYSLVDAADVEGLLRLFADTVVYERQGTATISGNDELRRFYSADRIIASGAHTLDEVLVGTLWVAVRGRFRGTLKNGDAVDLEFTDWFQVEDGVICRRQSLFPGRTV